ncbi:hypothetical protein ABID23_001413 [Bartonella silvatica]|uniref:Uncharacterized protein n=1 Tax=Bartonella silvatica TaxID=357760 RepID=A0ABV2HIC5_9HYPH
MFISRILPILITVVFSFSQIIEVNASLWRGRSQESILFGIVKQEKEIPTQTKNKVLINISDHIVRENNRAFIGPKVKKAIFIVMTFLFGKLAIKAVEVLKKKAGDVLYQTLNNSFKRR